MNKLLDVIDLSVGYKNSISNFIIENFNFYIDYSEIFGLIGPSGCGKTTIAWTVIGMINEMNGFAKGKIFYKGQQIFNDKYLDIEKLWWKEIAIVPQVSMSSFNPSLTIKETLMETMDACNYENAKDERCFEIMDMVQLDKKVLNYYPHEMSGGMKQRAAIATAMLLNPSLLILDESTTGLDVLVEAEILRMISKIRDKNKMSVLIISHDKRITDALCNRIYDMKGYSNECSCKSK